MDKQYFCADPSCECRVIGTLLTYGNYVHEVQDLFTEDTFTDSRCRRVWRYITEVAAGGDPVEITTVTTRMMQDRDRQLTPADLSELMAETVIGDWQESTRRLHNLEVRRRMKNVGLEIQALSTDETTPLDEVLNRSRDVVQRAMENGQEATQTLSQALQAVKRDMTDRLQGRVKNGSKTGFAEIDRRGGLHGSDLIVIAADTSQGKTSLAMAITRSIIKTGGRVAFYSMEMQASQLTERLLSMESGVAASTVQNGRPDQSDMKRINEAMLRLNTNNLIFDDRSTSSIDHIIASIRRMKMKYGIAGAVIDYLQILSVNTKAKLTKEQLMGDVARRLKNLAKELNIWVIALSQLNRDRDNPEPSLSRLRDSGQIAEAADVVMLIYRPEVYARNFPKPYHGMPTHNTALISVAKGRNTGIYSFLCGFTPETTLFFDENVQQAPGDEPF